MCWRVIFYYAYKSHNLVLPMVTGRRKGEDEPSDELQPAPAWRLAVGALVAAAIVWAITTGFYF